MTRRGTLACGIPVVVFILAATTPETELSAGESQTIAARSQGALFLISVGKESGTGFLIARDPPLVATVAHLASKAEKPEEIIVHANETGTVRKVRAVHVHKGFKKDQGGKNPYSADLAILELEATKDALGPPLVLAKEKADEDLRGARIVSMGFPSYTTFGKERESPEAVIRGGMVRRLQDYDGSTASPLAKRPMLEHDLDVHKGESGSPIMRNPSGKVIAVQVGTRRFTKKDTKELLATAPVAIHIRELWALLAQTGMTKAVQDADK